MPTFDIPDAFARLQAKLLQDLSASDVNEHPTTRGDNAELNWIAMLANFLPRRYAVDGAFVVDVDGRMSDQIDLVIHDRQYSPLLFEHAGTLYIPAESVYAVFEVKPEINATYLGYASEKAASVRGLRRTSAAIAHAGGTFEPREPFDIVAGILARRNGWETRLADHLIKHDDGVGATGHLDLGCALEAGAFDYGPDERVGVEADRALMFFALRLLKRLQRLGSATALDLDQWEAASGFD